MRLFLIFLSAILFWSCSGIDQTVKSAPVDVKKIAEKKMVTRQVIASHYSRSLSGRKTASGEIYDPEKLTCAHKTLPFGTILKVKNPKNSEELLVKINDRGPFIKGRELDLSNAAAEKLRMAGVQVIEIEIIN